MKPIGVVNYTKTYNVPLPEDSFQLLRSYPTDLIIIYLSKINVILFQESDSRQQAMKIFEHVFIKSTVSQLNYEKIIDKLISHDHLVIFAVQSISYLIKDALANFKTETETTFHLKKFHEDVFKTILIYNEIVYHTEGTELETHNGLWEIAIRQQNYIRDFNALFYTAPVKFMLIQRYFDQTPNGKQILASFQQRLSLGNFWNFAKTFMDLMKSVIGEGHTGQYIFNKMDVPSQALTLFSYDKSKARDDVSIHMDIIPKPFYQIDDDHFAVIDFSYFRYLLDQGVFWCIFCYSHLNQGDNGKNFNTFQSVIGHDYFEKFLVGNLFKSIFSKPHHLIMDIKPFEDIWIRPNQKDLIIIEVKMADLHPLTTESFDVTKFRSFIINNYAKSKDSNNGAKGIYQLLRQLHILNTCSLETLARHKIGALKKLNVYPVIIYSDQTLDVVGVNNFVQGIFENELTRAEPSSFTVKPITMLGVNTLLEQFSLFMDDAGNFLRLLRAYHKYIKGKRKDYIKHGGPFLYYEQNISFAEYIGKIKGRPKKDMVDNLAIIKELVNSGRFGKQGAMIED